MGETLLTLDQIAQILDLNGFGQQTWPNRRRSGQTVPDPLAKMIQIRPKFGDPEILIMRFHSQLIESCRDGSKHIPFCDSHALCSKMGT